MTKVTRVRHHVPGLAKGLGGAGSLQMGAGKQDRFPTGRPRAEGGRNWRTPEQQGARGRGRSVHRLRGELCGPGAPEGPEGGRTRRADWAAHPPCEGKLFPMGT